MSKVQKPLLEQAAQDGGHCKAKQVEGLTWAGGVDYCLDTSGVALYNATGKSGVTDDV